MSTPILPSSKIIKKKPIRAKSWECMYMGCDRTFRKACELKDHVDYQHKKIYHNVCDNVDEDGGKCGKTFETAVNMSTHKKKHNPELKIKCECCTRQFNSQSALQTQVDLVNGIFHNVCDHVDDKGETCGKTFEQARALTTHTKIHIRDAQRDMAPMEDHHVLETHHTVQSWE